MEHRLPHVVVLYTLIALLVATSVYLLFFQETDTGTWQCSNVACANYAGPDAWVAQNCFQAPNENGVDTTVCRVAVEGVNRLLPLSQLNLSSLSVCSEYVCVQEVRVRSANYSINLTG
jgi:hypothetical protein